MTEMGESAAPIYEFKVWAEALWFGATAAVVSVLFVLAGDADILDIKTWGLGAVGGAVRAAAGGILAKVLRR